MDQMLIGSQVDGKCIICYITQTHVFGSQVDGSNVFLNHRWMDQIGWIKC